MVNKKSNSEKEQVKARAEFDVELQIANSKINMTIPLFIGMITLGYMVYFGVQNNFVVSNVALGVSMGLGGWLSYKLMKSGVEGSKKAKNTFIQKIDGLT